MSHLIDQYRKRLDEKDTELNHLNELNLKLKEKILEFSSLNQQNVDSAKTHIAHLHESLDEKVAEIKERIQREQEMNAQIKKIQEHWKLREDHSQRVVFDEKAILLHELHLKRRWFNELMRNILICACARRIKDSIRARDKNYLRQVSFLCLKQEMVLQKHIRQMKKNRGKNLMCKAFLALQTKCTAEKLRLRNVAKQGYIRKSTAWTILKNYIELGQIERNNRSKAREFKEFNLKIKAWTVLMKYFTTVNAEDRFYSNTILSLSKSQVQDASIYDMAEKKRMQTLFTAFRRQIQVKIRTNFVKGKAFTHVYETFLSKGFVAFKMMIVRKKKCRQRAVRLRKIHLQNLVVKSFSALLFNAKTRLKVKQLNSRVPFFVQHIFMQRWIKLKANVEAQRVSILAFRIKWDKRLLKNCLRGFSLTTYKKQCLKQQGCIFATERNIKIARKTLATWREALRSKLAQDKATKYRVYKQLKYMAQESYLHRRKMEAHRENWSKRQALHAWQNLVQMRNQGEALYRKFKQMRLKQILTTFRILCKDNKIADITQKNTDLDRQVKERVQASQNASLLYQQRINQLEHQVTEKDQQISRIELVKEELRLSIVAKEQFQLNLHSRLEKSTTDLHCLQSEANLQQSMLAQRFSALEVDYRLAQDTIQEFKKIKIKLEGLAMNEQAIRDSLANKLETERLNNKQLLKELNRANKTITKLRDLLGKQTTRVLANAQNVKEKQKDVDYVQNTMTVQQSTIGDLQKKIRLSTEENRKLKEQQVYFVEQIADLKQELCRMESQSNLIVFSSKVSTVSDFDTSTVQSQNESIQQRSLEGDVNTIQVLNNNQAVYFEGNGAQTSTQDVTLTTGATLQKRTRNGNIQTQESQKPVATSWIQTSQSEAVKTLDHDYNDFQDTQDNRLPYLNQARQMERVPSYSNQPRQAKFSPSQYNEGNIKVVNSNDTPDWDQSVTGPYHGKLQFKQALQGKIKDSKNTLLQELNKATENIAAVQQPTAAPQSKYRRIPSKKSIEPYQRSFSQNDSQPQIDDGSPMAPESKLKLIMELQKRYLQQTGGNRNLDKPQPYPRIKVPARGIEKHQIYLQQNGSATTRNHTS